MTNIQIRYERPESFTFNPHNSRTHSPKQIEQLKTSMSEFGNIVPILTDEDNVVVAGHGRLMAAKELGYKEVPYIRVNHLNEAQKRAFIIADNKLTENGGWDNKVLAQEFTFLSELDFDVEITGFDTPEIEMITNLLDEPVSDPKDNCSVPEIDKPAITQPGDLWQLGGHRLYCGNSLEDTSYQLLMGQDKAQMVLTDPPYNVPIDGHVGNSGNIKHREFAMAFGEMSEEAFTEFLQTVMKNLTSFSLDGSIHYIFMDWRHLYELLTAARENYSEIKNLCVWAKNNGGMGSLYRSQHEMVLVCKHGASPHINNVQLGKHGRYRTNVWEYAGINSFGSHRMDELAMHPTVKPVAMVIDAIKDCSKRGGIILDPFGGSGTTLISAEKTKRKARLIELDPLYCDVIIRRWQTLTWQTAVHCETGKTFKAGEEECADNE